MVETGLKLIDDMTSEEQSFVMDACYRRLVKKIANTLELSLDDIDSISSETVDKAIQDIKEWWEHDYIETIFSEDYMEVPNQ